MSDKDAGCMRHWENANENDGKYKCCLVHFHLNVRFQESACRFLAQEWIAKIKSLHFSLQWGARWKRNKSNSSDMDSETDQKPQRLLRTTKLRSYLIDKKLLGLSSPQTLLSTPPCVAKNDHHSKPYSSFYLSVNYFKTKHSCISGRQKLVQSTKREWTG